MQVGPTSPVTTRRHQIQGQAEIQANPKRARGQGKTGRGRGGGRGRGRGRNNTGPGGEKEPDAGVANAGSKKRKSENISSEVDGLCGNGNKDAKVDKDAAPKPKDKANKKVGPKAKVKSKAKAKAATAKQKPEPKKSSETRSESPEKLKYTTWFSLEEPLLVEQIKLTRQEYSGDAFFKTNPGLGLSGTDVSGSICKLDGWWKRTPAQIGIREKQKHGQSHGELHIDTANNSWVVRICSMAMAMTLVRSCSHLLIECTHRPRSRRSNVCEDIYCFVYHATTATQLQYLSHPLKLA